MHANAHQALTSTLAWTAALVQSTKATAATKTKTARLLPLANVSTIITRTHGYHIHKDHTRLDKHIILKHLRKLEATIKGHL
jgi:malate synthase